MALDLWVEGQVGVTATLEFAERGPYYERLSANAAAERVGAFAIGGPSRHANMIRQFFDPDDMRRAVENVSRKK